VKSLIRGMTLRAEPILDFRFWILDFHRFPNSH
jgi:hypothetical protein